ncbi:hypothetical protein B9Q10_01670 [Candidatus Marsarchaeota G2 archaeon ECH_B_SAG-E12]|uniref:Uncharacterized protein n=1 Tax=Candidatus Marsarchaeota G2 archaeon ECH_B_SAG-E12 TaxID=1978164 RepID=A0A2R6BTZ3_9ARCH|nr:MAG: hypothetical protein B9Q10_01670 [Candidatus Marsarchaeota G2 archaeon ECH_B_SAG-E12]
MAIFFLLLVTSGINNVLLQNFHAKIENQQKITQLFAQLFQNCPSVSCLFEANHSTNNLTISVSTIRMVIKVG